MHDLTVTETV